MRIASVRGRTNKRLLYLMRVLFCKIHFSFICFCKPSCHLYTSSPLKLENTPPHQPPLPPEINSLASGQDFEAQSISISNGNASCNDHPSENGLKSSLRKASPESSLVEKKKVQWVDDVFGKQLVEIKEFEPSEDEDTADFQRVNERRCVCTFL